MVDAPGQPPDAEPPDAGTETDSERSEPADSLLRAVAHAAPLSPGPAVGNVIGNFRVEGKLGAGGMGVVYRAHDLRLHRQVALKLHSDRVGDGDLPEREARALARLVHPNVVTVHEVGSWQGRTYIAMEYLDAGTLRSWLAARRRPWREIVAIFLQAARGLAAAHDAGLVHRDFKPDNVLLGSDGRVRVADFGLARPASSLAPPGEGTPGYMAPEVAHSDEVDARADQYAFCVALRAALAGRPVPGAVDRILERGLHPDPARRHPSIAALIEALARELARRRWRWSIAALVVLAAVAVAGALVARAVPSRLGRGVTAPDPAVVATASSKYDSTGYGPSLAIDGDDRSAWCSGRRATPDAFDLGLERRFDDYVELRFPRPRPVGLIHMRSGLAPDDPAAETSPRTIRDFAWAAQREGSAAWQVIPGADLYANRQQLVLRVHDAPGSHALAGVVALRLYIRRDRWRWANGGDSTVCLREVTLAERDDARPTIPPWFLTIETDDDAGIERAQMPLPVTAVIGRVISALGGSHADFSQRLWLGELYPGARLVEQLGDVAASCGRPGARRLRTDTGLIDDCTLDAIDNFPAWVLHEPAPAAILLSGNTRHYHDREWRLALGLRALLRQVILGAPRIPVLGEGGGQQLVAMSIVHDQLPAFAHEFTVEPVSPSGPDRTRIYHVCNRLFGQDVAPEDLCGEYSNLPRRAVAPPYWMARSGARSDALFRFLEPRFRVWQGHVGTLDPARLASASFELIASYADRDPALPPIPTRPATAQAIRLAGAPIYGTLFAWVDHAVDRPCEDRDPANTTTELVFRNFLVLAMNVADPWRGARLRASSGSAELAADGDDATTWCGGDDAWLDIELREPTTIARLLWRRGDDTARSAASWTIEARGADGSWAPIAYTATPAAQVLASTDCPTGRDPALDADLELATLAAPLRTDALRIRTHGACIRELTVLPALR